MILWDSIEKKAEGLIDISKISGPAVPVKDIIKNKGLDVMPYDLGEGVSGTLVIENNKGYIAYNPSDSATRQRFTMAHELGHFLLHAANPNSSKVFVDMSFIVKYRGSKNYTPSEWKQEQQANAFAAALLMPLKFIKVELAKKENQKLGEVELIESLAKTFEVSVPAMTFRLNNINPSAY
jgi:Zn-dependent peptidase ImmA (M78 family)